MFKFVYLGVEEDYQVQLFSKEPVLFCLAPWLRYKGLLKLVYSIHNHPQINRIIELPFKKIWRKSLIDKRTIKKLAGYNEICFLLGRLGYPYIKNGCLEYLRKKFPNCKIICVLSDKVELYQDCFKNFDVQTLKSEFDLILTYNSVDAKKHGLLLQPPKCIDFSWVRPIDGFYIDVVFVGRDKGRIDLVYETYDIITAAGFKCWFHLVGVPKEKQRDIPGIEFGNYLPYPETLAREKSSRCILNIVQDGVEGITLRDYEAISMNKFLITNCGAIRDSQFYTPQKVINIDNLPTELKKMTKGNEMIPWKGIDEYSVANYYSWLDSELHKLK